MSRCAEGMADGLVVKRVHRFINQLDDVHREVIQLRFIADLPPKEISKILKLNANVVSVRITRGLEELREVPGKIHKQKAHGPTVSFFD